MRLVFAGTPAVAVPALQALVDGPHDVVAVVSRDDAPLGRRRVLTPSAVAARAAELGIATIKANRLDESATTEIAAVEPDLGVIVAYGGLVREPLLSTPRLGWINLHFSLLPRWRGAAPVQRAILAGDTETGAAVFQLVAGLDAGDVYASLSRPIGPDETSGEVLAALSHTGAELLAEVVNDLATGRAVATPQQGEPTAAAKISLQDARIDWSVSADAAYNRIRAVTPEPGAFTEIDGQRLKIGAARLAPDAPTMAPGTLAADTDGVLVGTASHPLRLLEVQPAGKRPMSALDWWRGLANRDGAVAR